METSNGENYDMAKLQKQVEELKERLRLEEMKKKQKELTIEKEKLERRGRDGEYHKNNEMKKNIGGDISNVPRHIVNTFMNGNYKKDNIRNKIISINKKYYGDVANKYDLSDGQNIGLFKFRVDTPMASNGSGVLGFGISTSRINNLADYTGIKELYSLYKVYAIKIKYISNVPNSTSVAFSPLHIFYDPTNSTITPATASTTYIQYDNLKNKALYENWQIYYNILPIEATSGRGDADGFIDMSVSNTDTTGGIYVYSGGLTNLTTYGYLVETYYIGCKNRM